MSRILAVAVLGFLCSACSVTRKIPEGQYLLQKVTIESDKSTPRKERITAADLEKYVRQTRQPVLLQQTLGQLRLFALGPQFVDLGGRVIGVFLVVDHGFEREESELTKRLLAENGLPNLAQVFTQRRYVRKDNLAISESYFALLKEKGFFNN